MDKSGRPPSSHSTGLNILILPFYVLCAVLLKAHKIRTKVLTRFPSIPQLGREEERSDLLSPPLSHSQDENWLMFSFFSSLHSPLTLRRVLAATLTLRLQAYLWISPLAVHAIWSKLTVRVPSYAFLTAAYFILLSQWMCVCVRARGSCVCGWRSSGLHWYHRNRSQGPSV